MATVGTKFWILLPREDLAPGDDPWEPWFDKCFGLIVEARTESAARKIAHENCVSTDDTVLYERGVYLDSRYTTCVELVPTGEERVVMADFQDA